ncbi:MAG: hypothetical protein Q7U04_12590 [Bacteriovorax sp.]|nr:hypothetical protein [Bacteriovorax sp.]
MAQVKIVKVPDGQAPEWVRKEWVGLVLPLVEDAPRVEKVIGVLGGKVDNADQYIDGYSVETAAAIDFLKKKNFEAAQWWINKVPFWFVPRLIFKKEDCELIKED